MGRIFVVIISAVIIVSCYGRAIKFVDQSVEIAGEDKAIVPVKTSAEDPFDSIPLKTGGNPLKTSDSNEIPLLPPLLRPKFEEPKITELSEDPFEFDV